MNRSNIGKLPAPADKVYMALRSFATKFDLSTIEPEATYLNLLNVLLNMTYVYGTALEILKSHQLATSSSPKKDPGLISIT